VETELVHGTARRFLARGLTVGILATGCFAAGWALAQEQVHMENALGALQRALGELEQAQPNKGGHRERAISLVKQAVDEVQQGIQWAAGSD
jgi:hypothetical protein